MNIRIFELERVQSLYENTVQFNLTESGFHPYSLKELLSETQLDELAGLQLGYGQTNGSVPLRQTIASLYSGLSTENVLITNGSAESNFIICHSLLNRGDDVVMMVPNYMQIQGIAEEIGCKVHFFHLKEENSWAPDLEELEQIVTPRTRMIALCHPNNPTGYLLNEIEMDKIIEIAKRNDSWIYSDEVYRGAELNGIDSPSFSGRYDKAIVNGSLSKAYALPGLRLGWLAGPEPIISDSWAYHDYTSISAGLLSQKIAEWILGSNLRDQIIQRNRTMLKENLKLCRNWISAHDPFLSMIAPRAGGMAFIRYQYQINSTELADRLRKEKSVFILAGDTYGMDGYFRIGIGAEKEYLRKGLERVSEFIRTFEK